MGADYIPLAFETARTADPDALLLYNDYQAEGLGEKSDRVYDYHDMVAACGAVEACDWVTFWGFTDRYTWIDQYFGLPHEQPLLFDEDYGRKAVYFSVRDALAGK